MKIKELDFVFEWYSGTGKGGQHRNKHQNCCRCIHLPTGVKANGTASKSRESNKRNALAVCKSRIVAYFHTDKDRYQAGTKRIRTYHAEDNRVTDHVSGYTDTYKNVVGKCNISDMIKARRDAMQII